MTGQEIEVCLGHFISEALIVREALSIPKALYTFITDSYYTRQPLWKSCLHECAIICGIIPLLRANLSSKWGNDIIAFDASPYGWGCCSSQVGAVQAKELGAWRERWRFRRLEPPEWAPRRRAINKDSGLAVLTDPRTLSSQHDSLECFRLPGSEQQWKEREGFPEFPPQLLDSGNWKTEKFGKFNHKEHIGKLEIRTAAWSVISRASDPSNHHKKHLHIGDNFGTILSLDKGRASSFGYLQQCRRIAAVSLVTGYRPHWRWTPSERNPGDKPSRIYEPQRPRLGGVYAEKEGARQNARGRRAWSALSAAFLGHDPSAADGGKTEGFPGVFLS